MRQVVQAKISVKFKDNLNKMFPNVNGVRQQTEKLNTILEGLIYGKTK